MRIALVIEYDGSQYHGWQSQTGRRTVEFAVEQALTKVADQPISLVCAGRTDTGVHATYQVVHFDTDKTRSTRGWMHGANSYLPKDVCVKWVREMPDDLTSENAALVSDSPGHRLVAHPHWVRTRLYERPSQP